MEDFEFDLSTHSPHAQSAAKRAENSQTTASVQSLPADVNILQSGSRFDESLAALREAQRVSLQVNDDPRQDRLARLLSLRQQLLHATEPEEAELIWSQSLAEVGSYAPDTEFARPLTEIQSEVAACRLAVQALHEDRIADCMDQCDGVLREKPHHVLFLGLKVKAKAADFSKQMAALAHIRALVDCGPLADAQAAIKKASLRFADSSELWELDFDLRAKAIEVRNLVERGEEHLRDGDFGGAAKSFEGAFQLLPFDTALKTRIIGVLHLYSRTIAEVDWQSAEKALQLVPLIEPDRDVPVDIAAEIEKGKLRGETAAPVIPPVAPSDPHTELVPEVLETLRADTPVAVEASTNVAVIDIGPRPGRRSLRHLLAVCAVAAALFLVVHVASQSDSGKPAVIPADITPGTLTLHVNVPDSTVLINQHKYDLPLGALAAEIGLPPDTYKIRIMHPGYADYGPVATTIKPGASLHLELQLKPNPAALELSHAEPGTKVSVDGRQIGEVPSSGTLISEIVPGQHSVELAREGYTAKEFVRFFSSGEAATLSGREIELQSTDARMSPPKLVATSKVVPPPHLSPAKAPVIRPSQPTIQPVTWQTAWQNADKHDAHSLQAFVTTYPDSPYATAARDQLLLLSENDDWSRLDRTNRPALTAFLASHPSGSHIAAATAIVADLDRRSALAEAQRQEEVAWLAVPKDNRLSIQGFMAQYPLSKHRDEAQRALGRLASLEANRAESAAILEVLHRFAAAWNAKDLKQIASIQHDLDVKTLKLQLAPVRSVVMKIAPVMAPQIDGTQATVVCRRQANETFNDGSTRQNPESIVTYVLLKQGSVWSIEHAH